MKRLSLSVTFLSFLIFIVGCAPRLPVRSALAPDSIPELSEGYSRVYFYAGIVYLRGSFGGISEVDLASQPMDNEIYIDGEKVGYINDSAIVVDLPPGTYKMEFKPYLPSDFEQKHRTSKPYEVTLQENEIKYLEGNIRDASSVASKWFGAVGALSGINFVDYLEEEPQEGPEAISKMDIAGYYNISND